MNINWKDHLKSAAITFTAEFSIYFIPAILGTTDLTRSTILAIVIMAIRGALKEVWETVALFIVKIKNENKNKTIEEVVKEIESSATTSTTNEDEAFESGQV